MIPQYTLGILSLIDIAMTYYAVKRSDKLRELNPIVRFAWKRFGLAKGTVLIAIPTFLIALWLGYFTNETLLIGFGAYAVVMMVHYQNVIDLWEKPKKERD